jgi:hypothetical protein
MLPGVRGGRRLQLLQEELATGVLASKDFVDFRCSDEFPALGMPLVGPLIVLPVKTENTFEGTVPEPETSNVAEEKSVNDGGNSTFECGIREPGL